MSDAWRYAVWPDPRSRSQALESQKFDHFQAISSPIYNGSWQMTTDSEITAQYLEVIRAGFFIFVLVFVSHDCEVGSK